MKLSSLIAKELRMKHLNEGIKHAQIRSRYRSFKLKEKYVKPQSAKDKFYAYSNIFGTEFIVKKESFDICEFSNPSTSFNLINNLMREINQQINSLWLQQRSLVKEEYFKKTKIILNILMTIIIISMLGFCLIHPSNDSKSVILTQENIEWSMVGGLIIVILSMLLVYFNMFLSNYTYFHYDTEVVKAISKKIISKQGIFSQIGLQIDCDAQLTWICFSSKKESMEEQSQINEFKQYRRSNFSPEISQDKHQQTSSILIQKSIL